jgi:periplasmic protein TonB
VTDPVLRVLDSRSALIDQGYDRGLLLSGAAHAMLALAAMISAFLASREPLIKTVMVQAIPLPRGGEAARPAKVEERVVEPVETKPEVKEAPAKPAPAPVLVKPKTEVAKKGVAPVDQKTSVKERPQESREVATEKVSAKQPPQPAIAPTTGAGAASSPIDFVTGAPGTNDGTLGVSGPLAFYLAAAKNKIQASWLRQIRPDFSGSVRVAFVIRRDGTIEGIQILESSGSSAIDRLAERTLLTTQLGPLPNVYDKETLPIHATFKPLS